MMPNEEQTDMRLRLMRVLLTNVPSMTEEDARALSNRAIEAEQQYVASLRDETLYDEEDVFETVFLALVGEDENKNAQIAYAMDNLMDVILA